MDNLTLRKKLSSYVSDKGYVKGVTDDILNEILVAWEQWTGSSKEFYRSLGLTAKQMSPLLGKAEKLKREGLFGSADFKQVSVDAPATLTDVASSCLAIEILWTNGRVIRFSAVDYLIDFLKKSA